MLLSKKDNNHPEFVQHLVSEWFDSFEKKYGFQRDHCTITSSSAGRYFATLKNGPETPEQIMLPVGLLVDTEGDKCLLSIYKRPRTQYWAVCLTQKEVESDRSRCRQINKKLKTKKMKETLEDMVGEFKKENINPKVKINELEQRLRSLRESIKMTTCELQAYRILAENQ